MIIQAWIQHGRIFVDARLLADYFEALLIVYAKTPINRWLVKKQTSLTHGKKKKLHIGSVVLFFTILFTFLFCTKAAIGYTHRQKCSETHQLCSCSSNAVHFLKQIGLCKKTRCVCVKPYLPKSFYQKLIILWLFLLHALFGCLLVRGVKIMVVYLWIPYIGLEHRIYYTLAQNGCRKAHYFCVYWNFVTYG